MRFYQHSCCNDVIGAPKGWDQEKAPCSALPIHRTEEMGVPHVLSFWKPDAEELKALNEGGSVMLAIVGQSMPPVMVLVTPNDA